MSEDRIVNIYEAKTTLSKLLQEVAEGREITIARAGDPIAKIVPVSATERREMGFLRDLLWVADDFDETPNEIVEAFEA